MKISSEFILRRVVDSAVLVPFGQKLVDLDGMLTLNGVGAFLAEKLQEETTSDALVAAVLDKYAVDAETAARDVDAFLQSLREYGALVE